MRNAIIIALSIAWGAIATAVSQQESSSDIKNLHKCFETVTVGPIDLNHPTNYSAFDLKFDFTSLLKVNITKPADNHFTYHGKFGKMTYLGGDYYVETIEVLSPSIHKMFNVTYPIEIQVRGVSKVGAVITTAVLMEAYGNEHSDFLISLGIGSGKIRKIKADVSGGNFSQSELKTQVSLYDLFKNRDKFLQYEADSLFGNCEQTIYFVSKDIEWASMKQLEELSGGTPLKESSQRPLMGRVFRNFIENYLIDKLSREKTPSSFELAPWMYRPQDNETIGVILPQDIPGWKDPNGTLLPPPALPQLPWGLKYIIFYYKWLPNDQFMPIHIIVDDNFKFTKNIQPATLDLYLRANYPTALGTRPLVKLTIGIEWIDPEMLHRLEDEIKKQEALEKLKKAEEYKKQKHEEEKKKKEEINRIKAEEEAKKKAEEQKKKEEEVIKRRKAIRWEKRCIKWRLIAILNRRHDNDDAWDIAGPWKEGEGGHYTCVEWENRRIGEWGQDVDEDGNDIKKPEEPKKPEDEKPNPKPIDKPKVNTKNCKEYLSIVLNKNWDDVGFKDLVLKQCNDEKDVEEPIDQNSSESTLAKVSSKTIKKRSSKSKSRKRGPKLAI